MLTSLSRNNLAKRIVPIEDGEANFDKAEIQVASMAPRQRQTSGDGFDDGPPSPANPRYDYLSEDTDPFLRVALQNADGSLKPQFSDFGNPVEFVQAVSLEFLKAIREAWENGEPYLGTNTYKFTEDDGSQKEYISFARLLPVLDESGTNIAGDEGGQLSVRYEGPWSIPMLPIEEVKNEETGETETICIALHFAEELNVARRNRQESPHVLSEMTNIFTLTTRKLPGTINQVYDVYPRKSFEKGTLRNLFVEKTLRVPYKPEKTRNLADFLANRLKKETPQPEESEAEEKEEAFPS